MLLSMITGREKNKRSDAWLVHRGPDVIWSLPYSGEI
jgi:hypothetical protein